MNIPLLRKVQDSIRDENNPFSMTGWNTCIAGHAIMTDARERLGQNAPWNPYGLSDRAPSGTAARLLGLEYIQAEIFYAVEIGKDRNLAIRLIEELIASEAPFCSALEPRSSRAEEVEELVGV